MVTQPLSSPQPLTQSSPVLEVAILNVIPGQQAAFEQAIAAAKSLIAATPGFQSIEIRRCLENSSRYLLLVSWVALEDHTIGFRQSDRYQAWSKQLHPFYDPFPVVEHYSESLFGRPRS